MNSTFGSRIKHLAQSHRSTHNREDIKYFPDPIYHDIVKEHKHVGYPFELYITSHLTKCIRKGLVYKWMEDLGYREARQEWQKWWAYRGNVWDEHLSNIFDEYEGATSQVPIATIIFDEDDDPIVIRGKIDGIYTTKDGEPRLVDFKTINQKYLQEGTHVKQEYIQQVSFYAKVMHTEKYGLFFVTNSEAKYEEFDDPSGVLRTAVFDKIIERAIKLYQAYKKNRLVDEKDESYCTFCILNGECDMIETSPNPKEYLLKVLKRLEEEHKVERIASQEDNTDE